MGPLILDFLGLVRALSAAGIPFAVAGGFAVSLHGYVRATKDIDFIVGEDSLKQAMEAAHSLGYHCFSPASVLADGRLSVTRLLKMASSDEDPLMLDFLVYSQEIAKDFQVEKVVVDGLPIPVLSKPSLALIKLMRGSDKDRDDLVKIGISLP